MIFCSQRDKHNKHLWQFLAEVSWSGRSLFGGQLARIVTARQGQLVPLTVIWSGDKFVQRSAGSRTVWGGQLWWEPISLTGKQHLINDWETRGNFLGRLVLKQIDETSFLFVCY